ncbi:conserved Plasmodium protein, unknown function [Plasmodium malariae]|nr:conserved Plasmodium protein, unknown function [Plasmodium malariae]SCO93084.1 conserved Plasmodium protein, unknown function [Plasmodium malariae]
MFSKEKGITDYKKKKSRIREVTRKCLNLIDLKYNNLTALINVNKSPDFLKNYHFSDDEIKFNSQEYTSTDIYFPESTYTNNDFKNLLGWVPRNLKIEEPISTDSIPCAFFFSNDNTLVSDKIILYLHKFNEDLGTIIPTVYALHKKLNINIIAMEYSGYGASFDNYEQKLVSIVNDSFTILKFIVNSLKISHSNVYILSYEFLASCAIEAVNRFEDLYGKDISFGGLVLIKPKFLQIVNSGSITHNKNNNSHILTTNDEPDHMLITQSSLNEKYSPQKSIDNQDIVINEDHTEKEHPYSTSKELSKKKESKMNIKKCYQANVSSLREQENLDNTSQKNNVNQNGMKKEKLIKKEGKQTKSRKTDNRSSTSKSSTTSYCYQSYNGIITCDMSLFYSDSNGTHNNCYSIDNHHGSLNGNLNDNPNDSRTSDEHAPSENKDVPYSLIKRILKDTFDINHSINSIKPLKCSILIFHPENYSYKNSSSHILLSNATECYKKAVFAFDFMNEDFVTAFNWFFSQNCDFQKKEKLLKNLLYLYVHPTYGQLYSNANDEINKESNCILGDEYSYNLNNDFSEIPKVNFDGDPNEPRSNSTRNSFSNNNSNLNNNTSDSDDLVNYYEKNSNSCFSSKNTIHIPNEIFTCPEVIQEENN